MTNSSSDEATEQGTDDMGIGDDKLPEDLQPSEENPLAQPVDEDEAKPAEELDMHGGKTPVESDDEADEETDDSDDSDD